MNRKTVKILAVALACILLCAGIICGIWYLTRGLYDGAEVGMTFSEFEELIPQERRFLYLGYYFYENQFGDAVVAEVSDDYKTIASLRCFSKFKIRADRASAESITQGMDVYDVVSRLGTPVGTFTSGAITLGFELNDGSLCVIYFSTEMEVGSVVFRED